MVSRSFLDRPILLDDHYELSLVQMNDHALQEYSVVYFHDLHVCVHHGLFSHAIHDIYIYIYVVVQFYSCFNFHFPLFVFM